MTEDEAKPYAKPIPNWIPETRTVIVCWMMFSTFVIIMTLLVRGPPVGEGRDLLNTLLGMYVGTGLLTSITWWMGDAKGSDSTNKMQDKMADALGSTKTAPVVVVSWWSLLTDPEKVAITAKAKTDSGMQAVMARLVSGKADLPDLATLVVAGLLSKNRSDEIQNKSFVA